MAYLSRQNDERFRQPGVITPLLLLFLFIAFTYGSLFVGLLGAANWLAHAYNLSFFLDLGTRGSFLMVACFIVCWVVAAFIIALIPYYILRAKHQKILASKVFTVTIFACFHIFAFPWILWPMVRNGSPKLRHRRRQKLKAMAKGPKMQERLEERRQWLRQQPATRVAPLKQQRCAE